MDHAGKHLSLDFKRAAVELKGVDGLLAKGPIPRAHIRSRRTEQRSCHPSQNVIADEIQPCHRIGRHTAVQSVSDDHIVLIEASQKARHFVRCIGAVSIQHDHGIGIQAKRFSEAMSDSASLADAVLVNQQNAVLLCDLFGAVRAVAVHHQNRCFVPHRFQALVGKAVQHPCQSQGLIEYREHDNEMLHDRSSGLLPHVFAVHGSVDQVNH